MQTIYSMTEQMFKRNGRWVPRSQLLKQIIKAEEKKAELSPEEIQKDLELLKEKKELLESLEMVELRKIAKESKVKFYHIKGKERLIHEILLYKN